MKLKSTRQLTESELQDYKFDLFIGASGYEERCTYVFTRKGADAFAHKIILGFGDRRTPQRDQNDAIYTAGGCRISIASGDSAQEVRQIVSSALSVITGETIRILVDYTCMTRCWYAAVLDAVRRTDNKVNVECVFSYSPAAYAEPPELSPNAIVDPIPGFCSIDTPDKPTALIIGLGYESFRALGLIEYIDPAIYFVFYTDPVLDVRYKDIILKNNSPVLQKLQSEGGSRIFRHPLGDLQRTSNMLISLCDGLREDYRVILAPLGVKPFSLLCLLIASQFNDIDVWRVSTGAKSNPVTRKPLGPILALQTEFVTD